MKFALAKEHREYFAQNHYIEFDEVLTGKEIATLTKHVRELLKLRLKQKGGSSIASPHEFFLLGRDLWRDDPTIQKILFQRKLGETAASLFKQPLLRLAFDQYQAENFTLSLQQMSSITPLIASLAIPLDDNDSGRVIYFSPMTPLKLPFMKDPMLILSYTGTKAQYTLKKEDHHTHALKKLGYTFGDLLNNDAHPILFR